MPVPRFSSLCNTFPLHNYDIDHKPGDGLLLRQHIHQYDAILAQLVEALTASQDRDMVAALLQPRSEEAAQRSCSVHQDFGYVIPS
jgi:hypothetical protein